MFFVTEGTEGGRAYLAVAIRIKSGYKNVEGHNKLLYKWLKGFFIFHISTLGQFLRLVFFSLRSRSTFDLFLPLVMFYVQSFYVRSFSTFGNCFIVINPEIFITVSLYWHKACNKSILQECKYVQYIPPLGRKINNLNSVHHSFSLHLCWVQE